MKPYRATSFLFTVYGIPDAGDNDAIQNAVKILFGNVIVKVKLRWCANIVHKRTLKR